MLSASAIAIYSIAVTIFCLHNLTLMHLEKETRRIWYVESSGLLRGVHGMSLKENMVPKMTFALMCFFFIVSFVHRRAFYAFYKRGHHFSVLDNLFLLSHWDLFCLPSKLWRIVKCFNAFFSFVSCKKILYLNVYNMSKSRSSELFISLFQKHFVIHFFITIHCERNCALF